ncbi:MAG: hypothetical protein ACE5R4_09150 [Armatimonadota bacterium]
MRSDKAKKKRRYEKPAIVYARKIEAMAATCSSALLPSATCQLSVPTCDIAFGP